MDMVSGDSRQALANIYCVRDRDSLGKYLEFYIPMVVEVGKRLRVDLADKRFGGDHVGVQVLNGEDFDECSRRLLRYANLVLEDVVDGRRNNVYQLMKEVRAGGIGIRRVEVFEPKPGAELRKLRLGVEHVAFKVGDYSGFVNECLKKGLPIDKQIEKGDSKFFKTVFLDGVEIEFRSTFLGVS